jgi:hypothetical protein
MRAGLPCSPPVRGQQVPVAKGLDRDGQAPGKPMVWAEPGPTTSRKMADFSRGCRITVSMLAGDREGKRPTHGARAERFPITAFSSLGGRSQQV